VLLAPTRTLPSTSRPAEAVLASKVALSFIVKSPVTLTWPEPAVKVVVSKVPS